MTERRFMCLVHDFPLPVDDGSKHRVLCMLEALRSWGDTRVALSRRADTSPEDVGELEERTKAQVILGGRPAFVPIPRHRLWPEALLRRVPPWFLLSYDPAMPGIARANLDWATHLVVLDDFAAQYLPAIGSVDVPVILDKHQVYAAPTALGERPTSLLGRGRRVVLDHLIRVNEARTMRYADRVIVTTDEEAARLEAIHGRVPEAVVNSGIEQEKLWSLDGAERDAVLWLGSLDSRPNRQGLDALLDHLDDRFGTSWPIRLVVAGRGVDEPLRSRVAGRPVELLGFVEDFGAVVRRCAATIIPLQGGGGLRIKTIQLLGSGIPVVTTPTALEGVRAEDRTHCRVADRLPGLVDALLDVLADPPAAAAMGDRAHHHVAAVYSWRAQRPSLDAALGGA